MGLGGVKYKYALDIVGQAKSSLGRIERVVWAIPVQEAVHDDVLTDVDCMQELEDMISNIELPECYANNSIVQEFPDEHVLPLGVFIDAVPYSIRDASIGFWIHSLVTGSRMLVCVLRKSVCCHCGCGGWCTFDQIFLCTNVFAHSG